MKVLVRPSAPPPSTTAMSLLTSEKILYLEREQLTKFPDLRFISKDKRVKK